MPNFPTDFLWGSATGLRRVVKPSAVLYGEVARTGSLAALAEAAAA